MVKKFVILDFRVFRDFGNFGVLAIFGPWLKFGDQVLQAVHAKSRSPRSKQSFRLCSPTLRLQPQISLSFGDLGTKFFRLSTLDLWVFRGTDHFTDLPDLDPRQTSLRLLTDLSKLSQNSENRLKLQNRQLTSFQTKPVDQFLGHFLINFGTLFLSFYRTPGLNGALKNTHKNE